MGLLSGGALAGAGEYFSEKRKQDREDARLGLKFKTDLAMVKERFNLTNVEVEKQRVAGVERAVNSVMASVGTKLPKAARGEIYSMIEGGQKPSDIIAAYRSGTLRYNTGTVNKQYSVGSMEDMSAYWGKLEGQYGLPAGYLASVSYIESSLGTNNVPMDKEGNILSSARGMFQFIDTTAKEYDVDVTDWKSSSLGAAKYAASNMKVLKSKTGRDSFTGEELYMAHQQGPSGASKLLNNPTAMAVNAVSANAVINNIGDKKAGTLTAKDFSDILQSKYHSAFEKTSGYRNTPFEAIAQKTNPARDFNVEEKTDASGFSVISDKENDPYKYLDGKDTEALTAIAADTSEPTNVRETAKVLLRESKDGETNLSYEDYIVKHPINSIGDIDAAIAWVSATGSSKITESERESIKSGLLIDKTNRVNAEARKAMASAAAKGEKIYFYKRNTETGEYDRNVDILSQTVDDEGNGVLRSSITQKIITANELASGLLTLKGDNVRGILDKNQSDIRTVNNALASGERGTKSLLKIYQILDGPQGAAASNKYVTFGTNLLTDVKLLNDAFLRFTRNERDEPFNNEFIIENRENFVQSYMKTTGLQDDKSATYQLAQQTLLAAYDLAASKGSKGQALSDKELKSMLENVLGVGKNQDTRKAMTESALKTLISDVEATRSITIDSLYLNAETRTFIDTMPYAAKTIDYVRDRLAESTIDGEKELLDYYKIIVDGASSTSVQSDSSMPKPSEEMSDEEKEARIAELKKRIAAEKAKNEGSN